MPGNRFIDRFPKHDVPAAKLLAKNVKRLRKARGLTQDQLAADVDIEQSAVSLIENARANPGLLVLDAIAKVLGCRMRDLFDDEV
jgi:transcriptional regulator with XRE-family HTH domain